MRNRKGPEQLKQHAHNCTSSANVRQRQAAEQAGRKGEMGRKIIIIIFVAGHKFVCSKHAFFLYETRPRKRKIERWIWWRGERKLDARERTIKKKELLYDGLKSFAYLLRVGSKLQKHAHTSCSAAKKKWQKFSINRAFYGWQYGKFGQSVDGIICSHRMHFICRMQKQILSQFVRIEQLNQK